MNERRRREGVRGGDEKGLERIVIGCKGKYIMEEIGGWYVEEDV